MSSAADSDSSDSAGPGADAAFDFEKTVAELEALVAQLESGQLPLDASLDAYRRGTRLLVACRERLAAVRQQVQMLDDGVLHAFDAGDTV
jgi:exodeoxyribonuclease VII small subunit